MLEFTHVLKSSLLALQSPVVVSEDVLADRVPVVGEHIANAKDNFPTGNEAGERRLGLPGSHYHQKEELIHAQELSSRLQIQQRGPL